MFVLTDRSSLLGIFLGTKNGGQNRLKVPFVQKSKLSPSGQETLPILNGWMRSLADRLAMTYFKKREQFKRQASHVFHEAFPAAVNSPTTT